MAVAHLAFQFGPRHQRGNAVYHQHVDCTRTDQGISNLQCLFASVRLTDQQVVDIKTQLARICRIQGVLSVDKRTRAPAPLRLRNRVQRQGRLT